MGLRNTTNAWGTVSKFLHWLIVLLVLGQWLLMQRAESLPLGAAKLQAINAHKSLGMSILALTFLRLVWRWLNPVPSLAGLARPWERALARASHVALYGLLLALPLTGWLMSSARNYPVSWFGLFQFPDAVAPDATLYRRMNELHHALFATLTMVAALHVLGALKHHFLDRNTTLRRMLPFGGAALLLTSLMLPLTAAAQGGPIRHTQAPGSQLSFTFTQLGAATRGRFRQFSTELWFDEQDLAASALRVTVQIASVDTQDAERDAILRTPELFDADRYPTATFIADSWVRQDGRLEALGLLTIRGISKAVRLPLQISPLNGGMLLTGQVVIRRLDFGVGQGEWQSTESIADEVKITYQVSLTRAN
jgi:cytochrome b561/polyisoprenoid-binding protein YceI